MTLLGPSSVSAYPLSEGELRHHRAALEALDEPGHYGNRALDHLDAIQAQLRIGSTVDSPISVCPSANYLGALRGFAKHFDLCGRIALAPGHGSDVSHCEALLACKKIINVEIDPLSVAMMRRFYQDESRISSYLSRIETFTPKEKIDLVVLLGTAFNENDLLHREFIVPGALIVTGLRTYRGAQRAGSFEALGVFDNHGQFVEGDISSKDRPIATKEELLEKAPSFYRSAVEIVYRFRGTSNNLIENYTELRETAIDQRIAALKEHERDPERMSRFEAAGIPFIPRTDDEWLEVRAQLQGTTLPLIQGNSEYLLRKIPLSFQKYYAVLKKL